MDTAKTRIAEIIKEYIRTYPIEWADFCLAVKEKLSLSSNDFGEISGSDLIERKLFEMPETLYIIFKLKMDEAEFEWFKTKEGSRWFVKTYPQFNTSART